MPYRKPTATDLLSLIDKVQAAALDGGSAAWSEAMEKVAGTFAASSAYLQPYGGGGSWLSGGPIVVGADPDYSRSYVDHYGKLDPVVPAVVQRLSPGQAIIGREVIEPTTLWRTEFGWDWCWRQQMVDTLLGIVTPAQAKPQDGWGILVLTRDAKSTAFETEERDTLEVLLPHIRNAVGMSLRLGTAVAERNAFAAALEGLAPQGALLLDARRRVVFASCAAETLLSMPGAPLLIAKDRTLQVAAVGWKENLEGRLAQALTRQDASPTDNTICLSSAAIAGPEPAWTRASVLTLKVLPIGPAEGRSFGVKTLILLDGSRQVSRNCLEMCRKQFGLTPAEARVAYLLAENGSGAKALARHLGVSPATARTHLQRLFEKTGTHSQTELVSLLRQLAPRD